MPLDAYDEDWDGTPSPVKKSQMQVLEQQQAFVTPEQNGGNWTSSEDDDQEKGQEDSFIDYEPYLAEALNAQNITESPS